ncbi:MAG: GNAT family N-acetyltransferase [Pseudomonadota bacterium]
MTSAPIINTDRLTLRPHQIGDFDAYADMFASDRATYMGKLKRRHAWYSFTSDVAQWALLGTGAWAIADKADGTFLGQTAVMRPDHFPETELGWFVFQNAEGKGIAQEAASAARDWYWQQDFADTLVSYIDPDNDRSIKLATRLGAVPDADAPLPDGETPDETVVYRHTRPQ